MPIVIEAEARGAEAGGGAGPSGSCGWDITLAETLFWEAVPVRLRLGGQDDRTRRLDVRILMWDNSARRMPKSLGVILTSEDNNLFLYTMEVSEEDFATLRQDQGILVDFNMFPSEIISLLKCCISTNTDSGHRFQAVLDARGSDGQFSIVETNQFKHLTHISLLFRQGTDKTIKQYLSSRLQEVISDSDRLEKARCSLTEQVSQLEKKLAELNEFHAHGKQAHERSLNEITAGYEKQIIEERNRRVQDLSEANERANRELSEAAQKHNAEKDALHKRLAELDTENHALRDQKYTLDSRVSQLSAQHGSVSGELMALREECSRLKELNLKTDQEKHELERRVNEANIELAGLKSQVTDKESLNVSNSGRVSELEKTKSLLEVALEESREQHREAEQRFREQKSETEKGIQIIERFKNEISSSKSKVKTYKAMLQNQENQKKAVEDEYERLKTELQRTQQQLQSLQRDREVSQSTIEDQKQKLSEAHQQIDSNRKFISYLNTQCNQAQLASGPSSGVYPLQGSSRYNLISSSIPPAGLPSGAGAQRTRPSPHVSGYGTAGALPPKVGYYGAGGYESLGTTSSSLALGPGTTTYTPPSTAGGSAPPPPAGNLRPSTGRSGGYLASAATTGTISSASGLPASHSQPQSSLFPGTSMAQSPQAM